MCDRSKILLVQSDDDLREAIAASIAGLGAEVEHARDGEEGLERLGSGLPPPGAILLDARAPRLDHGRFFAAVRAEPRLADIPIVTMGDAAASGSQGSNRFDVDELARILVSLCDR